MFFIKFLCIRVPGFSKMLYVSSDTRAFKYPDFCNQIYSKVVKKR